MVHMNTEQKSISSNDEYYNEQLAEHALMLGDTLSPEVLKMILGDKGADNFKKIGDKTSQTAYYMPVDQKEDSSSSSSSQNNNSTNNQTSTYNNGNGNNPHKKKIDNMFVVDNKTNTHFVNHHHHLNTHPTTANIIIPTQLQQLQQLQQQQYNKQFQQQNYNHQQQQQLWANFNLINSHPSTLHQQHHNSYNIVQPNFGVQQATTNGNNNIQNNSTSSSSSSSNNSGLNRLGTINQQQYNMMNKLGQIQQLQQHILLQSSVEYANKSICYIEFTNNVLKIRIDSRELKIEEIKDSKLTYNMRINQPGKEYDYFELDIGSDIEKYYKIEGRYNMWIINQRVMFESELFNGPYEFKLITSIRVKRSRVSECKQLANKLNSEKKTSSCILSSKSAIGNRKSGWWDRLGFSGKAYWYIHIEGFKGQKSLFDITTPHKDIMAVVSDQKSHSNWLVFMGSPGVRPNIIDQLMLHGTTEFVWTNEGRSNIKSTPLTALEVGIGRFSHYYSKGTMKRDYGIRPTEKLFSQILTHKKNKKKKISKK